MAHPEGSPYLNPKVHRNPYNTFPFPTTMTKTILLPLLLLPFAAMAADTATPAPAPDAALGRRLFNQKCALCHAIKAPSKSTGANLAGIVGTKAGTTDFANYSDAMKKSGLTWTDASLDAYLADPEKKLPGTTMKLATAKPEDRANLIAYLKSLAAEPAKPDAAPKS